MAESQPHQGRLSNLTLRIISAAVLAPIVILAVWIGGLVYAALVVVAGILGFLEWTRMSGMAPVSPVRLFVAAALGAGLFAVYFRQWQLATILLLAPAAILIAVGCVLEQMKWAGLGALYIAVPASGLVLIRIDPDRGLAAIFFVILVVWATDIAAYFGGRAIGGPRLWPQVSPKKTWAGGLSGLAAALLVGAVVSAYLFGAPRVGDIVVAGILSVFSQAGDFLESAVKRRFGAKDSGNLIPGHGGILDRLDGMFGASAAALVLSVAGAGSILPVVEVSSSQ